MPEITINLHIHTRHSDGTGTHQDIAEAALNAGLQAVIVTDHNNLVQDQEGYYARGKDSVLLLIGEEINDQTTLKRNNHLLVFGVNQELANLAGDTQKLINTINYSEGLSFLAHPIDPAAPRFNQGDFSWDKWDVTGYTGIELWNGFSEFKTRLTSIPEAIWYAYNPKRIARGPIPETMEIWDHLIAGGKKVVAVGGSDAHAMAGNLGPLKRTLFPYLFHFKCVNTHLILPTELTGDLAQDQGLIYEALAKGHAFIGYDLPYSSKGFQFKGTGSNTNPMMGDETSLGDGITLKITLPIKTDCILYKDGQPVKNWQKRESCTYAVTEPGVYRVEVYIQYKGRRRGWIYSNPIYIRK